MSADRRPQWSPARNPYAIAVSQSWWTLRAVLLFAADAKASTGETQQIYARQILGQLRMLLRWAVVLADELARLGVDQIHRDTLQEEIAVFESAIGSATTARNILEHLDDYARGDGRLQRDAMNERDIDIFDAAVMFWGGGYDPFTDEITEGPFAVSVPDAIAASQRLHRAIYRAARAVDAQGR